jgi:hypothetical protein
LAACNRTTDTQSTENHLVKQTVDLSYEQSMIVPEEYWFFSGIDFSHFVSQLTQKTLEKKITAYYPLSSIEIMPDDLQKKFATPQNEIQYLVFDEEWVLDTAKFEMKKYVQSYTIVREYIRKTLIETEEPTKSLLAKYIFKNTQNADLKKLTLLKKNVSYEVTLENSDNPEWLENINRKHTLQLVIDCALQQKAKAYSFMLRDSLIELSVSEIKQRLGDENLLYINYDETNGDEDTVSVHKEIDIEEFTGLAFIEDWYIDNNTMQIYKDVKGIAPVRIYQKMLDSENPNR